ncbi:MarR family winged helix-turn-helix transcriptional regulator [Paenibacillus tarimensis]
MNEQENKTVRKLMHSFRQLRKAGLRQNAIAGMKPSDMMVLFCLKKNTHEDSPGMMVSEISAKLCVTSPTVTQQIKSLEADGYIERNIDPADRRAVRIRLSKQGEEFMRKVEQQFLEDFSGLVDYLGEEDSNRLAELLNKSIQYFQSRVQQDEP